MVQSATCALHGVPPRVQGQVKQAGKQLKVSSLADKDEDDSEDMGMGSEDDDGEEEEEEESDEDAPLPGACIRAHRMPSACTACI